MTTDDRDAAAPSGIAAALFRAFGLAAGDTDTAQSRFTDYGQYGPGMIDKRCILQAEVWVDQHARLHELAAMSVDYRRNILAHLRQEAPTWIHQATLWIYRDAIIGLVSPAQAKRDLELLDLLTAGWTDHTPLGLRLHELNNSRPDPLQPPPRRATTIETDEPDILRAGDAGIWLLTTESGTSYLLDLDKRRVLRQPAGLQPAAGNGARMRTQATRATPPASRLGTDGEWAELTHLISCTVGRRLLVFDRTSAGDGYRVSTTLTHIALAVPEDTR